MPRHIVCLTFDFDAQSGFISRGLTTPTPLSRGEFGIVGAARILSLLAAHDIRSTWFVPGFTIETYPAVCEGLVKAGHEIGHHSWTHTAPALQTREQEEEDMLRANEAIRQLTGRKARGYRSPAWDLSPNTIDALAQGFEYDRTSCADTGRTAPAAANGTASPWGTARRPRWWKCRSAGRWTTIRTSSSCGCPTP